LAMMKIAFERRLIFRVGQSVTTGQNNSVVWNGIHQKTNTSGGATNWGWPDDGYFARVKQELAAKGVTEEDIAAHTKFIGKSEKNEKKKK